MHKVFKTLIFTLSCTFLCLPQNTSADLLLKEGTVTFSNNTPIVGEQITIYARVHNNSFDDLFGEVRLYNETENRQIGTTQDVSVIGQSSDDIIMPFTPNISGDHTLALRVIPKDTTKDNIDNNKVFTTLFVDTDFDEDGIGDTIDTDDDNDGVADDTDIFPFDPNEQLDFDGDGIGDNADTDDDNDGVADNVDAFPQNPSESKDSDNDGSGDNIDAFPLDATETIDSDNDGLGDNADTNDNNKGPVIDFSMHISPEHSQKITFDAENIYNQHSFDPDGSIVNYEWFIDDQPVFEGGRFEYEFPEARTYTISLRVTDNSYESRTLNRLIDVQKQPLRIITLLLIIFVCILVCAVGIFIHHKLFFKRKKRKKRQSMSQFSSKCTVDP